MLANLDADSRDHTACLMTGMMALGTVILPDLDACSRERLHLLEAWDCTVLKIRSPLMLSIHAGVVIFMDQVHDTTRKRFCGTR